MNDDKKICEFKAQIKFLLLEAGYEVTDDVLVTITKGHFVAELMTYFPEEGNGCSLCFRIRVRGKALNQLSAIGRIVLVNALSVNNPAFNITYHHRGRAITLRYYCNLYEPEDVIYQLTKVKESYDDLRKDMKKRLPDFIKQFPCPETQDKQLVKTLRYLHRWRLE